MSDIASLEAERARLLSETEQTLRRADASGALSETELAEVRRKGARVDDIDAELRRAEANERRARHAAAVEPSTDGGPLRIHDEPTTYGKGSRRSYFADLVASTRDGDTEAQDRLRRHANEVRVDAETRVRRGQEEFRDLTRVDGAGGQFVPPLHLIDDYVTFARASRPTANLLNARPLPAGTDSLNVPQVTTGTTTAIQTADNAAVQETDLVDGTIAAPVRTIAGQQDVAVQLLEQSPIAFDDIIFGDLIADYNQKLDVQVLSGSGTSGQLTGVRTVSGINAVTYTDATPTVAEIYPKLADAIQQIATGIFMPATAIVMHPRRWAWFTASLDNQSRPLVVPDAGNPTNAAGTMTAVNAEGAVGQLMGLPVYVDPNIPTNLGVTEDVILVLRAEEIWLFESTIRTRVLPDVGSGTLTTRLQVYNYAAMATRRPKAISTVGGSGLIAPTF